MSITKTLEVWQRGPVPGVSDLLQPVAHALLQAQEEIERYLFEFPEALLWERPTGVASPAFHLQHLTGVLDRLFTYALERSLSPDQLEYLAIEGKENPEITVRQLLEQFGKQVEKAIDQLKSTDENTLTVGRLVGRAKLPSTVIGLYTHAAEHTMRHVGQLYVTIKILKESNNLLRHI